MGTQQQQQTMKNLRVTAVMAHPDDAEISLWGSLCAWRQMGATVGLIVVTSGDAGARLEPPGAALAARRQDEARRAAATLGIEPVFLGFPDGRLVVDAALHEALRLAIGDQAPHLLVTHAPAEYHGDHRVVSQAVQLVASFRQAVLWCDALRGTGFIPNVYVDIGAHVPAKRAAIACHVSQEPARLVEAAMLQNQWRAHQCNGQADEYAEAFRFEPSFPFSDIRAWLPPAPPLRPLGSPWKPDAADAVGTTGEVGAAPATVAAV